MREYCIGLGPGPASNPVVDEAIGYVLKGPFRLKLVYRSRGAAEASARTIEPLGILLGARRYLVGIDVAKRDGRYRHYRVEDIMSAEPIDETFVYPDGFSITKYAEQAFGSYHNSDEIGPVVWKFSPEAAERAQHFEFHPS